MFVLVLPVSGGGFVSQLGILQHLCEIGFIPDVTLASSGGNVSAYICSASNWRWAGIERIAQELSPGFFVQPWATIPALSIIVGYFKGDMYHQGTGVHSFLNRYFDSETITKHEIWTGTYNKTQQKARLFCNLTRAESILDPCLIDHELTQSLEPVYAGGDIALIGDASIASASIPGVVAAQRIYGEEYVDGGVGGASPMSIMKDPLLDYVKQHDCPLHLVYVNSVDLSHPHPAVTTGNFIDNVKQITHNIVRSQTVIDRLACYEIFERHGDTVLSEEFVCTNETMKRITYIHTNKRFSMTEFYPTNPLDINIVSFDRSDIVKGITDAYKNCKCRLWYFD
jgi:hypothetical protein